MIMLEIKEKISLKEYTTFKLGGEAEYFVVVKSLEDFKEAWAWAKSRSLPLMILGGGSNTIFEDEGFRGLVIKNEIKGIELIEEEDDKVIVEAKSGELWSAFVNYLVENNYYGLENTFLIPGTVGASAIQNIGAYGVEMKDCFLSLKAFNLESGEEESFSKEACRFSYRDSFFKQEGKNKYFIVSLRFVLSKQANFKLDYGDIKAELAKNKIISPSAKELVQAIMTIRNSKLPNPAVLANAGSFFKNPEINSEFYERLREAYPEIKSFPSDKAGLVKIPAGWLIERAGFKGYRHGNFGVYENNALILVNYGEGSLGELLILVKEIKDKVLALFGIELEEEVNLIA